MLCQFSFKNFKCFYNEGVLDMQAAPISEHEEGLLVDADDQKFLPIAAIYGPNGSGKSTVLEALVFLISVVMRPINILKNNKDNKIKSTTRSIPFKFNESSLESPSEFELFFRTSNAVFVNQKLIHSLIKN